MKKAYIWRGMIYMAGLLILALGITLNTKTGFGVSALVSVSYCVSVLWNLNFGNMTFILYAVFMLFEMAIHLAEHMSRAKAGPAAGGGCQRRSLAQELFLDLLQLPMSLILTRFINLFGALIPDFAAEGQGGFAGSMAGRLLMLLFAIVCTGGGSAMSLNMRLVPCPADGVVQAFADTKGIGVGLVKNGFDFLNLCIALALGLIVGHRVIGIGIGTVAAMLGVGRVIAVFNGFFMKRLCTVAGVESRA